MNTQAFFNEGKMAEFLSKHDMIYEKPPVIWDKGLPLANSNLSAMIWGENPLNVTIDRMDLWEIRRYEPNPESFTWHNFCKMMESGNVEDFGIFGQKESGPTPQRLPVGRFQVNLKGSEIKDYSMRLALHDALASGYYTTELGGLEWSCYVSADSPIIAFRYKVTGKERVDISFKFVSELGAYLQDMKEVGERNPFRILREFKFVQGYPEGLPEFAQILRDWGYPDPQYGEKNGSLYFQQTIPENGDYAVVWRTIPITENENMLVVSIAHDRVNGKSVEKALTTVSNYSELPQLDYDLANHKRWWHDYYPRSFFSFPDTKLEALYWMEIYKLGCVARPDAIAPPANGPWCADDGLPQFVTGGYFWNQQQQGILMPIYTANRLEFGRSSYELLKKGRQGMKKYCEYFFKTEGEFLPHITTLDCKALNCNPDQFEFLSGPWMCQFMWWHYKYSMDKEFLRDTLYPMMREQIKPILSNLERWDDGKLHLRWTMSAEYQGEQESYRWSLGIPTDWSKRYGPDASSDIGYLRFLCEALLESSELLSVEDPNRAVWQEALNDLVEFKLDKFGGLMVRGDLALESSHRHLAHLFPIHLLHQINFDEPDERKIIENSLYVLKLRGMGEWMGWTFCEVAKICILANQPARARMLLMEMVDKVVHENSMDTEGSNYDCGMTMHGHYGMTLEGDGIFASALQDFACRSFNGTIYVLDSLPEAWDNVSFWHFRAEGAFLVSAQRRTGKTDFISIYSEQGGVVRLVSEYNGESVVHCEGLVIQSQLADGKLVFDTVKGKEYIISPRDFVPENLYIMPVDDKLYERNYFGVKKKSRH